MKTTKIYRPLPSFESFVSGGVTQFFTDLYYMYPHVPVVCGEKMPEKTEVVITYSYKTNDKEYRVHSDEELKEKVEYMEKKGERPLRALPSYYEACCGMFGWIDD